MLTWTWLVCFSHCITNADLSKIWPKFYETCRFRHCRSWVYLWSSSTQWILALPWRQNWAADKLKAGTQKRALPVSAVDGLFTMTVDRITLGINYIPSILGTIWLRRGGSPSAVVWLNPPFSLASVILPLPKGRSKFSVAPLSTSGLNSVGMLKAWARQTRQIRMSEIQICRFLGQLGEIEGIRFKRLLSEACSTIAYVAEIADGSHEKWFSLFSLYFLLILWR